MNKNSNIMVIGGIAIIIIAIIGLYNFQEKEIEKEDSSKKIEISEYDPADGRINEKLEDIKKNADENYFQPAPREWIKSGPFEIDRSKYHLGEKVFLRIGELHPDERGQIAFLKQTDESHYTVYQTIPFDGATKAAFNYYTDIKLLEPLGLCTVEDVIGEWTVVFRGTEYPNIKFEVIDKIIPGEESSFQPVC